MGCSEPHPFLGPLQKARITGAGIKSTFSFLCLEADQPEEWGTVDCIKSPVENTAFVSPEGRNERFTNVAAFPLN